MWASKEQFDFLESWIEAYQNARAARRLPDFWPELYSAWFERWPDTDDSDKVPQAGNPPTRTWFNNRTRGTEVNKGQRGRVLNFKTPRRLPAYQVYQKLFKDELQPKMATAYDDYLQSLTPDVVPKTKLVFQNETARVWLGKEKDDVKAQVEKARNSGEYDDVGVDEEDVDDEEAKRLAKARRYQSAIDLLPTTAMNLVTSIEKQTGWMTTILFGGPMPDEGGKIVSYS
ncbi:hypothetical protein FA95DRAFT_1609557 [Auriscalpium vulgare]|uniref:Uncharacterized protein n=1 Tax=Auriscalpium vulgare TaxID=40419 RepID=A0ACB8RH32_9AGAM|nr:hypothetical protein FA95DRAFT_1609557 [Auriscalpium vulgare]